MGSRNITTARYISQTEIFDNNLKENNFFKREITHKAQNA